MPLGLHVRPPTTGTPALGPTQVRVHVVPFVPHWQLCSAPAQEREDEVMIERRHVLAINRKEPPTSPDSQLLRVAPKQNAANSNRARLVDVQAERLSAERQNHFVGSSVVGRSVRHDITQARFARWPPEIRNRKPDEQS